MEWSRWGLTSDLDLSHGLLILPECDAAARQRARHVDDALVARAAEAERDVVQLLHKAPVHEHVNEREQLVRDLAAGMGAVGVQLLPGEAGESPDGLARQSFADKTQKKAAARVDFRVRTVRRQEA